MQRACAAALLHRGESSIHHAGHSNDDRAAIELIQQMGAIAKLENDQLLVSSAGVHPKGNEVNCGESGLGIRMFAPHYISLRPGNNNQGAGKLVTASNGFF